LLASYSFLQWTFITLLVGLVGAAGVFGIYVFAQLWRNPQRRN
jgi:hypothetical protein